MYGNIRKTHRLPPGIALLCLNTTTFIAGKHNYLNLQRNISGDACAELGLFPFMLCLITLSKNLFQLSKCKPPRVISRSNCHIIHEQNINTEANVLACETFLHRYWVMCFIGINGLTCLVTFIVYCTTSTMKPDWNQNMSLKVIYFLSCVRLKQNTVWIPESPYL